MQSRSRLIIIVLAVTFPLTAMAGALDDFERDSTKKQSRTTAPSQRSVSGSSDDDIADICLDTLMDDCLSDFCLSGEVFKALGELFGGIAAVGALSWDRAEYQGMEAPMGSGVLPRKSGEALVPLVRFDLSFQNVESDITAWDARFEAGYGPFAFQFRRTVYDEQDPAASLTIRQYHALYRMSFGSRLEIDIGAGTSVLDGLQENSGFSMTAPVLFHPSHSFGLEFRPVWSTINENDIQDFDLAVLAGWRYASLRAGYRWVRSPNQSLDGPHIGISLRW